MLPGTDQCAPLNPQGSHVTLLSWMQLSPNKVRLDFDIDAVDLFPVFEVSPRSDVYQPLVSPISALVSPLSCASPAAGFLPDFVTS